MEPQAWATWFEQAPDPFANQQPYTYNTYQLNRDWFDQYVLGKDYVWETAPGDAEDDGSKPTEEP